MNSYAWYRERVFKVETPLMDRREALQTAELWGEVSHLHWHRGYRKDRRSRQTSIFLF
ncbi:MAG: hypothetical protein KKC25_05535 [Proteobacteria bacterium]|nr:hypothetical protein [Pseudomonadota bacterium]